MAGQSMAGLVSFPMAGACQKNISEDICFFHTYCKFDTEINYWSDKGQTVFNRKNKQTHVFYGLNVYKKGKYNVWRENSGRMDKKELFVHPPRIFQKW